jgi:hypothetical protein
MEEVEWLTAESVACCDDDVRDDAAVRGENAPADPNLSLNLLSTRTVAYDFQFHLPRVQFPRPPFTKRIVTNS